MENIAAVRASIPAPATAPEPSPQRKKRSYELARRRIAEEKNQSVRGFVYGIFFAIFGGLLLVSSLLRMLFVADDWLNLVGLGFGVVIIPIGVYITAWFSVTLRAWNKDELDLEAEISQSSGE